MDSQDLLEAGTTQAVCLATRAGERTNLLWLFLEDNEEQQVETVRKALTDKPHFVVYLAREEFVKVILDDDGRQAR